MNDDEPNEKKLKVDKTRIVKDEREIILKEQNQIFHKNRENLENLSKNELNELLAENNQEINGTYDDVSLIYVIRY